MNNKSRPVGSLEVWQEILSILLTGLIVFLPFFYFAYPYLQERFDSMQQLSKIESTNQSIFDFAEQINQEVTEFYYYNDSKIGKEYLGEDNLRKEGGVCIHYAKFYDEKAKNAGYLSKIVRIDVNENFSHAFTVISNDDGYCLLDQTKKFCFKFKKE